MSPRTTQVLAVLASVGAVLAASTLHTPINGGREKLNVMGVKEARESVPPEYAFAIQAFGAFRGLITNFAFIRAEEYKRDGRYYDAMQLANWICKLQPRFPSVWEFQSWNMAWNISVAAHTAEERWNWVYSGAKLIRDEGIPYNPRALNLYKQLAWIFVNKMSENTDEFNMYYKRTWAYRMHLLLGNPPDPLGEYRPGQPFERLEGEIGADKLADAAVDILEERLAELIDDPYITLPDENRPKVDARRSLAYQITKRAFYDEMIKIANAPRTLPELYAETPAAREIVAQLRDLDVNINDRKLTEERYMWADGLAEKFFKPYRQLVDPIAFSARIRVEDAPTPEEAAAAERRARFDEILGVSERRPAGQAVLRFLQRKVLTEVYKLDPAIMAELIDIFGPMDYRVVDAHSLYWVYRGLLAGNERLGSFQHDKTNTARMIFFSLRNMYLRNRIVFEADYDNPNRSYLNFNPDFNFIESLHLAYLQYGRYIDPRPEAQGAGGTYRTGHINFLSEVIRMLYFAGLEDDARYYYEYLRETYGLTRTGSPNTAFDKPLHEYVIDSFRQNNDVSRETRNYVTSMIRRALHELAAGNVLLYTSLLARAQEMHAQFNEENLDYGARKMLLPPFTEYQSDVVRELFREPAIHPFILTEKARLWEQLPPPLKRPAWDAIREQLAVECERMRFNFARAFPPPPGIDEYREQRKREAPDLFEESDVETPAQSASADDD